MLDTASMAMHIVMNKRRFYAHTLFLLALVSTSCIDPLAQNCKTYSVLRRQSPSSSHGGKNKKVLQLAQAADP